MANVNSLSYGFSMATQPQVEAIIREHLRANYSIITSEINQLKKDFVNLDRDMTIGDSRFKFLGRAYALYNQKNLDKMHELYERCNHIIDLMTGRLPIEYSMSYIDSEGTYHEVTKKSLSIDLLEFNKSGTAIMFNIKKTQDMILQMSRQQQTANAKSERYEALVKEIKETEAYQTHSKGGRRKETGYLGEAFIRFQRLGTKIRSKFTQTDYEDIYKDSLNNTPWYQIADVGRVSVKTFNSPYTRLVPIHSLQMISNLLLSVSNQLPSIDSVDTMDVSKIAKTLFASVESDGNKLYQVMSSDLEKLATNFAEEASAIPNINVSV